MTTEKISDFAKYAADYFKTLGLELSDPVKYGSLPVCIVDCVYSLRSRYGDRSSSGSPATGTCAVVERYEKEREARNVKEVDDRVSDFLAYVKRLGDEKIDAEKSPKEEQILKWRAKTENKYVVFAYRLDNFQTTGGRLKAEVCFDLAKTLMDCCGIETLDDFRNFVDQDSLYDTVHSVKGVGDAATNYLFMLAGDPDKCKPDTWIKKFMCDVQNLAREDSVRLDFSDNDIQSVFTKTVEILKGECSYKDLTVRQLDFVIWTKYSSEARSKKQKKQN